jgi:hypothetical protein
MTAVKARPAFTRPAVLSKKLVSGFLYHNMQPKALARRYSLDYRNVLHILHNAGICTRTTRRRFSNAW